MGTSLLQVAFTSILLLVLYRYLRTAVGLERFGVWAAVSSVASLVVVAELGFGGGTLRYVTRFQSRSRPERSAEVLETAVLTVALAGGSLALLLYPLLDRVLLVSLSQASASLRSEATSVLPWALALPLLTSVSSVLLSGLDALHRVSIRNLIWVGGAVVFALGCVLLVPQWGLRGVAWAQAIQFSFICVTTWFALRHSLSTLSHVPRRWSRPIAKTLFRYGASWQAIAAVNVCIDPLFKMLAVRFGGPALAGHIEFAQRIATQVRNLITAGQQALLPLLTHVATHSPEDLRMLYGQSLRVTVVMLSFGAPLAWLAGPLGTLVWEGAPLHPVALLIQVLVLGALASTVSLPAYFDFAGRGTLRPNLMSLLSVAGANVALGTALGIWFGGWGVVMGYVASLVLGSLVLLRLHHRLHPSPSVPSPVPPSWYLAPLALLTVLFAGGWESSETLRLELVGPIAMLAIALLAAVTLRLMRLGKDPRTRLSPLQ